MSRNMTADPENLMDLGEKSFHQLVDADTRGTAPAGLSSALRTGAVARRWYDTLLTMQRSVEGQLAAKAADSNANIAQAKLSKDPQKVLAVQAESERWRAGAIRFKVGLEQKLIEAKRLLREIGDTTTEERLADERNRALAKLSILEDAIRRHRDNFDHDDEPSDSDVELWSYVGK